MTRMSISEINLRVNYLYLRDMKTKIEIIKRQNGGLLTNTKIKKLDNEVNKLIDMCKEHFEIMDAEREIENKESSSKEVDNI